MKVFVISYLEIKDASGKFVEKPWITHSEVFTCKEHAEMEVKTLKGLETELEMYAYTIDECTLHN